MRAVGLMEFGGPEVLHMVELPDPEAGPGEVRIRVRAAAVNPTDTVLRSGGRDCRRGDHPQQEAAAQLIVSHTRLPFDSPECIIPVLRAGGAGGRRFGERGWPRGVHAVRATRASWKAGAANGVFAAGPRIRRHSANIVAYNAVEGRRHCQASYSFCESVRQLAQPVSMNL